MTDKPTRFNASKYYTKIPESILELHRQGGITSEALAIYIHLVRLARIRASKTKGQMSRTSLTNEEIADYCNVSTATVKRAVKSLKSEGVIDAETRHIQVNGKWKHNARTITLKVTAYEGKAKARPKKTTDPVIDG